MPDELTLALANADKVRSTHPVQGMKVTTVAGLPRWVAIKFGNGPWKPMPVTVALAYTRMLRAKTRYKRLERRSVKPKGKD